MECLCFFYVQIDSIDSLILLNSVGVPANAYFQGVISQVAMWCWVGGSKGVKHPAKGGFSQHHLDGLQQ